MQEKYESNGQKTKRIRRPKSNIGRNMEHISRHIKTECNALSNRTKWLNPQVKAEKGDQVWNTFIKTKSAEDKEEYTTQKRMSKRIESEMINGKRENSSERKYRITSKQMLKEECKREEGKNHHSKI